MTFYKQLKANSVNIFCVSYVRCWTPLWTWWKRHGGQWACSGVARNQTARSSTTGDDVQASRRTLAKEAQALLPSPRHTAPTLQSRVCTAIFNLMTLVCHKKQQLSCHFCDCPLFFTVEDCFITRGWSQNNGNQLVVQIKGSIPHILMTIYFLIYLNSVIHQKCLPYKYIRVHRFLFKYKQSYFLKVYY